MLNGFQKEKYNLSFIPFKYLPCWNEISRKLKRKVFPLFFFVLKKVLSVCLFLRCQNSFCRMSDDLNVCFCCPFLVCGLMIEIRFLWVCLNFSLFVRLIYNSYLMRLFVSNIEMISKYFFSYKYQNQLHFKRFRMNNFMISKYSTNICI